MSFYRAARAVAESDGEGPIDWAAVASSAKAATDPGELSLSDEAVTGYRNDVRSARDRIREVGGLDFDLPDTIQVMHRHHWIDANIATFERIIDLVGDTGTLFPRVARTVNTGTMAVSLSFLANNVLGQYDPLLLSPSDDHSLYFVHPNIGKVATLLDVDPDRFRRWIAFHEVTHAAEFGAAPWLTDHLDELIETAIDDLSGGRFRPGEFRAIDTTMTAVEGYAELLMDRTFDAEYADLRRKLDARRRSGGPLVQLMRRVLGLGRKRRQYERGKEFFEAVVDARDLGTAALVWEGPGNLPRTEEFDDPEAWLRRMGV